MIHVHAKGFCNLAFSVSDAPFTCSKHDVNTFTISHSNIWYDVHVYYSVFIGEVEPFANYSLDTPIFR